MATNISWWIAVAFVAAALAGGALRLGLAHTWAGFGGVVLLALPSTLVGWNEGWRLEAALAATAGAMALGAILPDLLRGAAQGVVRLVQWAVPIIVGFVALAYYVSAFGPDRTGEDLAGLILVAIIVTGIWSRIRPARRNRRNGDRR